MNPEDTSGPAAGSAPGGAGAELGSGRAVWLVARREILARVRNKAFILGTLGLVAAIGFVGAIPAVMNLLFDDDAAARVAAAPQAREIVDRAGSDAGGSPGASIETVRWPGRDQAEQAVSDGDLDAALVAGDGETVLLLVADTPETGLTGLLNTAYAEHRTMEALEGSGADTRAVDAAMDASLTVQRVGGGDGGEAAFFTRMMIGFGATFLLYMSILVFGVYVAQGVVEEKASRVVELLLATVRPWQLLFGKIVGIGALGLLQVGLVLVAAAGVGVATDYFAEIPVSLPVLTVSLVAWFVVGYLFFASLLAGSASLVSRQEDVQSAIQPVIVLIAVPLAVTFMTFSVNNAVLDVLAILPPFSPFMMPMRLAMGEAALWENLLALALLTAALIGAVWLAARVYTGAVLGTGAKLKATEAFRAGSR
ncbi:ABC transporter permease [Streptomonospora salina]|uniref:ABC-2 type transport system permease protein n=1 Tax=Streptomonospora salina TaxID=104205 RepID=A0A841EE00_9ACTN|nr:ABC transporter permease [Streptomonospora salina]MBB5998670.1 ABC-2 type transport system permease protein [Streptomonospora salina]